MALSDPSILTDPHPRNHIVYPYSDEKRAINAIYVFASAGLLKGEAVVLIMADSHCEPICQKLIAGGFNVDGLQTAGLLHCIKAEDLLAKMMLDGLPDERLFKVAVGGIIRLARTNSAEGKVRMFGEMVNLLFRENNIAAAERMEELWNEMIDACSVALLCTYELDGIERVMLPESLSNYHSHTIGAVGAKV
jgi:hypothetical protein